MPRQSRIDAPGALHHVIFRGIERKAIFRDDADVMNSSNGSHRYKSILCQGETYLLELTRYIHLNPLRVGIVKHLGALDTYLFAGHSVIMGNQQADWRNDTKILVMFA